MGFITEQNDRLLPRTHRNTNGFSVEGSSRSPTSAEEIWNELQHAFGGHYAGYVLLIYIL